MEKFVQLHVNDNIVIALKSFEADTIINVNGEEVKLIETIDFGHKIAIKSIATKDKILKYGLSIGSATQDIVPGEHVHSHNLETDYLINQ
ncbi:UxaA family hydrolase [Mariniflexile litorale]|uniref:UxaA family hydrolase n=1 Tax=Mariniflexile litorale TaxID=3045158 RepID=A0AAU7EF59_9FLAO|nr:UxaA family hydrolase [Mariniflexile sp. KMM 9835]MDQ8210853.1 UxaA family hydrolase [Mariniflexile sp. KMM 9835]